jgi:hypothetical protein
MNGLNGKPTEYPENALVPYPVILAASKGDGRYENGLAAFQRLYSKSFHAEAL